MVDDLVEEIRLELEAASHYDGRLPWSKEWIFNGEQLPKKLLQQPSTGEGHVLRVTQMLGQWLATFNADDKLNPHWRSSIVERHYLIRMIHLLSRAARQGVQISNYPTDKTIFWPDFKLVGEASTLETLKGFNLQLEKGATWPEGIKIEITDLGWGSPQISDLYGNGMSSVTLSGSDTALPSLQTAIDQQAWARAFAKNRRDGTGSVRAFFREVDSYPEVGPYEITVGPNSRLQARPWSEVFSQSPSVAPLGLDISEPSGSMPGSMRGLLSQSNQVPQDLRVPQIDLVSREPAEIDRPLGFRLTRNSASNVAGQLVAPEPIAPPEPPRELSRCDELFGQ